MRNKQYITKLMFSVILLCVTAAVGGCTADKDIKADIAQKAKTDINFAAVKYTVDHKVVTLMGNCPSVKAREKVLQAIKDIHVIKDVVNRIQIAPVLLGTDFVLKQDVDSVLAAYPGVEADVANGRVSLSGKGSKKDIEKLTAAVKRLGAGQLTTDLIAVTAKE